MKKYFFCPNPNCRWHSRFNTSTEWCKKTNCYNTKAHGRIQRYQCLECGKHFSDQTFSLNYYLKKRTNFSSLSKGLISSSSCCLVARHHNWSYDSLRLRIDRLARNALILQVEAYSKHDFTEPLVTDGFESYTLSKYFPTNINLLMGSYSEFVYYANLSHSRRKGRTSQKQKEVMSHIYNDKSLQHSSLGKQFPKLLGFLYEHQKQMCQIVHSDEHKLYAACIQRYNRSDKKAIHHIRTSSLEYRDIHNPLWAVNYFDRLIRKDLPDHRRKTICFARNDNAMMQRFWHYVAMHNYFKPKRINNAAKQNYGFHYQGIGLNEKTIGQLKEWFHEYRFFQSQTVFDVNCKEIWMQQVPTPFHKGQWYLPKFCTSGIAAV